MQIRLIRQTGFTLVEIMIVVAIVGLLASIALPSWHRARENAQLQTIANNLRLLESAKQQWALDNKKSATDTVTTTDMVPYLKNNTIPQPVVGESYQSATVADLITAQFTGTLLDKPGPFTVTSF